MTSMGLEIPTVSYRAPSPGLCATLTAHLGAVVQARSQRASVATWTSLRTESSMTSRVFPQSRRTRGQAWRTRKRILGRPLPYGRSGVHKGKHHAHPPVRMEERAFVLTGSARNYV